MGRLSNGEIKRLCAAVGVLAGDVQLVAARIRRCGGKRGRRPVHEHPVAEGIVRVLRQRRAVFKDEMRIVVEDDAARRVGVYDFRARARPYRHVLELAVGAVAGDETVERQRTVRKRHVRRRSRRRVRESERVRDRACAVKVDDARRVGEEGGFRFEERPVDRSRRHAPVLASPLAVESRRVPDRVLRANRKVQSALRVECGRNRRKKDCGKRGCLHYVLFHGFVPRFLCIIPYNSTPDSA